MAKIKIIGSVAQFHCPGCDRTHDVELSDTGHAWNGSADLPTLRPAVVTRWTAGDPPEAKVCTAFVSDGNVGFVRDSAHALAGRVVALPDVV